MDYFTDDNQQQQKEEQQQQQEEENNEVLIDGNNTGNNNECSNDNSEVELTDIFQSCFNEIGDMLTLSLNKLSNHSIETNCRGDFDCLRNEVQALLRSEVALERNASSYINHITSDLEDFAVSFSQSISSDVAGSPLSTSSLHGNISDTVRQHEA